MVGRLPDLASPRGRAARTGVLRGDYMSTTNGNARVGIDKAYNPDRLFLLSCIALIAAAWVFALRASIMKDLGDVFQLDGAQVGASVGTAFLAFGVSVFIGSPLCDFLGMGRLLGLASILHIGGIALLVFAPSLVGTFTPMQIIMASQITVGFAHGLVEAVINPLAATIYPDNKTHKLNVLHAWWPGGIAMGGVLAFFLQSANIGWQTRFAMALIPSVIYGAMIVGQKFPPTERVASNISNGEMVKESFRPAFLLLVFAMLFTASVELGPGQWVDAVLTNQVGFQAILVLVYVSMLMFVFRFFAGALAHKFSPVGLMCFSSLLAGLGLLALSYAQGPVMGILAATIWGMGVCYMWPTMLGIASERFPRGGAFAMGLIGAAGSIVINYGLALIGGIYDHYTQVALGTTPLKDAIAQATTDPNMKAALEAAKNAAAPMAFRWVSLAAFIPLIIFAIWWMVDKKSGGYKAIKLVQADPADFSREAVLETDVAAVKS
jgi:MFS family permease